MEQWSRRAKNEGKNPKTTQKMCKFVRTDRTKGKCQMSLGFVVATTEKYRKVFKSGTESGTPMEKCLAETSAAVSMSPKIEMRKVFASPRVAVAFILYL